MAGLLGWKQVVFDDTLINRSVRQRRRGAPPRLHEQIALGGCEHDYMHRTRAQGYVMVGHVGSHPTGHECVIGIGRGPGSRC